MFALAVPLILFFGSAARAEEPQIWAQNFFDDLTVRQCPLARLTVSRCQPHGGSRQSTKMEGIFGCGGTDYRRLTLYRVAEEGEAACDVDVRESCRVEYSATNEPNAQRLARIYTESASDRVLDLLWTLIVEKSFALCPAKSGLYVQTAANVAPREPTSSLARGPASCQCQFRCNESVVPQELSLSFLSADRCHERDDAVVKRAELKCTSLGSNGLAGSPSCHFGNQ